MTIHEIRNSLNALFSEIELIPFPDIPEVAKLLALVEACCSKIAEQEKENRQLKDEINRLKGEQCRPAVKGRTTGQCSTESERKSAEETLMQPSETGFRLTVEKLNALKGKAVPDTLLDKLLPLKNRKFINEDDFISAVTETIGEDLREEHRESLLNHARYIKRNRKKKIEKIEITRTEICKINVLDLPEDAILTGYEDNVVQDIKIERDNILFRKQVYYSPSQRKTYVAQVPPGHEGGFGPNIKTDIISMKYISNMSEPKIAETLQSHNVIISPAYISSRLTSFDNMRIFIDEKNSIFPAALVSSSFQQADDTGCRVNGVNQYVHILCNHLYTLYVTLPGKDRMSILNILRNFKDGAFIFNDETYWLLEHFNVSSKKIDALKKLAGQNEYNESQLQKLLAQVLPNPKKHKNTRARITEAAAIAHYYLECANGIGVNILIADDAPQFKLLTKFLGLCWVHAGRHFKKLNPIVPDFMRKLTDFQEKFWAYYATLLAFQKKTADFNPTVLEEKFDLLFATKTGYPDLDERIDKTRQRKKELLLVLKYPEIPLHNNRSENGARTQKRRQDVSLQTKSAEGTIAKDTMMSIVETCKKLEINPREFIRDRILCLGKIKPLAELIKLKAANSS